MSEFINIGCAGDKNFAGATIDISALLARTDYTGTLSASILCKRKGDDEAYPAANVTLDGSTVTWKFSEVDAAVAGMGEAQVVLTSADGTVIGHGQKINTRIYGSLTTGRTVPSVYQPYINQVLEAKAAMDADAASAEASATEAADSASAAETSATEAGNSASAAAASETAAGNSASAAAASATGAAGSASSASASAASAAGSAKAAETSAAEAASSATTAGNYAQTIGTAKTEAVEAAASASGSASAAAQSENNASASATAAAKSASAASTSAGNASDSETNASRYASAAATSASNAAGSATAAAGSATAASNSESSASASAGKAATSETNAATSESNAAQSASAAATSASNAAGSATAASASETNAGKSATAAAGSATAASISEKNAATSETNASKSATAAGNSATAAATSATEAKNSADSISGLSDQIVTNKNDILYEATERKAADDDIRNDLTLYALKFDGTKKTYKKVMKEWFLAHGAETATTEELTALCDEWYTVTRTGWNGGTLFANPETSTVSTGTRFGDNEGLSCTPSTNTAANQDDYAGLPQFAICDCNWILDDDGNILVTALDGITSGFERSNPEKFVGVLQMSMYHYWQDNDDGSYLHGVSDKEVTGYANCEPYPEAVRIDGTIRPWVCHEKYMASTVNGKLTGCSGYVPTRNISHNSLITLPDSIGTQYSGGTVIDWSFLVLMTMIKYASMSQDGINQGCVSYSKQCFATVAEENVKRVIVKTSDASYFEIGSTILLGENSTASVDRGSAACYSISGMNGFKITAIDTYDSSNSAITVDADTEFTTSLTTVVSTYHWASGSCDAVLGNDGSPCSASNGKDLAMIQGIEYSVGGYEVFADVILSLDGENYTPYLARRSTYQATSVTSNMVASALKSPQPASDSWNYIVKHGYDGEIFFGVNTTGGGSGSYVKDGFYKNSVSTKSALREWLSFGTLNNGSGFGGLSCLNGGNSLGGGNWNCLARLSPNGNRGECEP